MFAGLWCTFYPSQARRYWLILGSPAQNSSFFEEIEGVLEKIIRPKSVPKAQTAVPCRLRRRLPAFAKASAVARGYGATSRRGEQIES
jgi:hypothetical protein